MHIASNTHTIVTIQAKMSQKIEPFIAGAKVQDVLKEKSSSEVEQLICNLSKGIEELGTHLESLSLIANKISAELTEYNLKEVLLNYYEQCKETFENKKIKVNFDRIPDEQKIKINYKLFDLVMHHFFDNAAKYCKENSNIEIIFSTERKIVIEMNSLTIENYEDIFHRGGFRNKCKIFSW